MRRLLLECQVWSAGSLSLKEKRVNDKKTKVQALIDYKSGMSDKSTSASSTAGIVSMYLAHNVLIGDTIFLEEREN